MKQDYLLKEYNLEDHAYLNQMLGKGFFIIGQGQWNRITCSIDYHLRRTLFNYIFRNLGNKKK